ncbi:MAG: hypothetical protein AVDCRST_MAG96-1151, partial [uncultured Segetibacter sp.]
AKLVNFVYHAKSSLIITDSSKTVELIKKLQQKSLLLKRNFATIFSNLHSYKLV